MAKTGKKSGRATRGSTKKTKAKVKAAPTGTCIVTTPIGTRVSHRNYTEADCKAWAARLKGTYEWP